MYMMANNKQSNGTTFVEIITAMSITLIISSLVFTAYLSIYKEFRLFTRKADSVMQSVVSKKKIDAVVRDIGEVQEGYKATIAYLDYQSNDHHLIHFGNAALFVDNKLAVNGIKSFDYSISEKQGRDGTCVLHWQAVLVNGHWLGGSHRVKVTSGSGQEEAGLSHR